ncbi:MAG TPA: M48 family metallopeptidase [Chthonomonadaceae bacterium]|nr:M48 family metallopeptidase [Chthonomonadaceae bacterium]
MRYAPLIAALLLAALFAPRAALAQNAPSSVIRPAVERSDPYTPHLPARAYAYHRANRILVFVGIAWRLAGFLLLLGMGISARLRNAAERFWWRLRSGAPPGEERRRRPRAPAFVATAAYYLLYSVYWLVWSLPVGLADLAVERRFGFSDETLQLYLKDDLIGLCRGWVMIPVIWVGYRIYLRWPRAWWLVLSALLVPISLFVTVVYPVVISPLYNHYTPLPAGPLRSELQALAARAGIRNATVLVEDTSLRTSHVNAYVTGIGPSARIVLNDTALQELPRDQILAMVGHEMGHYAERHVLISAAAGAVGTAIILWLLARLLPPLAERCGRRFRLRGLSDLAALPLIFLAIYLVGLAGEPVSSALSRTLEHRADAYGLRLTGLDDATARLMVGFAERDLTDPDPPPLLHLWFGTHPTLKERIAFARSFRPGPAARR